MKLEVDEVLVSENATADQVLQLDFTTPVLLEINDQHYLQWWVDEDDGSIVLCRRNGDWDTYEVCELDEYPVERIKPVFAAYVSGDQSGLEAFGWVPGPRPGDEGVIEEGHWEYYPCRYDDNTPGSIMYNHGISEYIDDMDVSQCIRMALTFRAPDEAGFANDQEREILDAVAGDIELFADEHEGFFVGQITVEGRCHFYTYATASEEDVRSFVEAVNAVHSYELQASLEDDPEKQRYWNDLFPDPNSMQLIGDMKVMHALLEAGDDVEAVRPIDHFASFEVDQTRDAFKDWAVANGFSVESTDDPDEEFDGFRIHLIKEDAPMVNSINQVTCALQAKCQELGGNYDGWETILVNQGVAGD